MAVGVIQSHRSISIPPDLAFHKTTFMLHFDLELELLRYHGDLFPPEQGCYLSDHATIQNPTHHLLIGCLPFLFFFFFLFNWGNSCEYMNLPPFIIV